MARTKTSRRAPARKATARRPMARPTSRAKAKAKPQSKSKRPAQRFTVSHPQETDFADGGADVGGQARPGGQHQQHVAHR